MKPIVGQKVWINPLDRSNAKRRGDKLREATVIKVGKKYYEVQFDRYGRSLKFELETNNHYNGNYSGEFKAYFNKQEIEDEIEALDLVGKIRDKIGQYGKTSLTLNQLKDIYLVIQSV